MTLKLGNMLTKLKIVRKKVKIENNKMKVIFITLTEVRKTWIKTALP